MTKLIPGVALALVLMGVTARPARACGQNPAPCPLALQVVGYGLAVGVIGVYAGVTGYYVYRDLTDDDQLLRYSGYEAGFNTFAGVLFTASAVRAIAHDDARATLVLGSFAALHDTLAVHAYINVARHHDELGSLHPPGNTVAWLVGTAYGTITLAWTAGLAGHHGRNYGIAEAVVNGSLAATLGYLAVREVAGSGGPSGKLVLFGGLAAISGGLAYHGVRTALHPYHPDGLDFLGDVAPTVVSDGASTGVGLGMGGAW